MNEIIFLPTEAPEGGYVARALGESIFTEADDLTELHERVRDADPLPLRPYANAERNPVALHSQEVIGA